MKFTFEDLAAVCKIGDYLVWSDDSAGESEYEPMCDFLLEFDGVDSEVAGQIIAFARNEMENDRALDLVSALGVPEKQRVADLLAEMISGDGEVSEEERVAYNEVLEICGLPDPDTREIAKDEDDCLVPAYLLVKTNGVTQIYQSENTEWSELSPEFSECIGAERTEVVRYTAPLNDISRMLGLKGCHLVFLVDRNGCMRKDQSDNMVGTMLYGAGSEIIGDIILALETDGDYDIVGFKSRMRLGAMIRAVDEAVDGLLRFE